MALTLPRWIAAAAVAGGAMWFAFFRVPAPPSPSTQRASTSSGALSVAALAFRPSEAGIKELDGPVVAVVSGGNVDPDRYRAFLDAPIPAGWTRA